MDVKTMGAASHGCQGCNQDAFDEIGNIIDLYKNKEGSLIQVLHKAQEIYGYLPLELQSYIADGLGMSLSEVSGVVTFYPFFKVKPHGRHTISICMGTACYVRGGKRLVETLQEMLGIEVGQTTEDGVFTFMVERCIGACGLAPAIMVDETVYREVDEEMLRAIIEKYRKEEVKK